MKSHEPKRSVRDQGRDERKTDPEARLSRIHRVKHEIDDALACHGVMADVPRWKRSQ
jgi:hypothetical protein